GHLGGASPRGRRKCAQLSKFPAYGETCPVQCATATTIHARYAPNRASLDRSSKPASLLQHEILADVRVGSNSAARCPLLDVWVTLRQRTSARHRPDVSEVPGADICDAAKLTPTR